MYIRKIVYIQPQFFNEVKFCTARESKTPPDPEGSNGMFNVCVIQGAWPLFLHFFSRNLRILLYIVAGILLRAESVFSQHTNSIVVGGGIGLTSVRAPFIKVSNPGVSVHFYADIPMVKFIFFSSSLHYWSVNKDSVRGISTSGKLRNFEFTLLAIKAKFPVLDFRPLFYGGLSFNQLLDGYNEQTARLGFDYGFGVEYIISPKVILRANVHSQAITSGINFTRPFNDSASSISYSMNIATVLE